MENKVLKAFESGEVLNATAVAEKSGVDKAEVTKIMKKLVKEEKIYSPKRCFYQVKK